MAEECHWNNTVGSYMVSFSGVADTFFTLRKPDITIFFSALLIAFSHGGWAVGMLLLSGAISPCITHARGASGTCRHRVEELSPLFAALRLSERMFHPQLPPSTMPSGKCCSSSLLLFHTVRAGLLTIPGQLSWWSCSRDGNDLSITTSRGIWILVAGRIKERLKST